MQRRSLLLSVAAAAVPLAACAPAGRPPVVSEWVGASHERGHRLRTLKSGSLPTAAVQRRAGALVLGGGVAGLAALRGLVGQGVADAHLLELEDHPGGNSRGHVLGGLRCPLGAHYLPVPGPAASEVSEWLHEIGLLRSELGRTLPDERHLCHSPQERLFIDGAWQDGLLPSAEGRPQTLAQYRRFSERVSRAQRDLGFAIPTHAAPWAAGHAALDGQTFATWLQREGLTDERLLAHLDYVCRDDYGAGLATVSAWAGLHYFASRHGFQVPGDDSAERDAVFTWPEGNAWLTERLAAPRRELIHTGVSVLRVDAGRHGVEVLVWNEAAGRAEAWHAGSVVLAMPLFITSRVLATPPAALGEAAAALRHAPWLVANLQLDGGLVERPGAPASWDNLRHAPAGSGSSLGYVDALHQSTRPDSMPRGATVLTAYHALGEHQRAALLSGSAQSWARHVIDDLLLLHPDLPERLVRVDLMRYGHAMPVPVPGARGHPALAALRALNAGRGRLRFAHADLAAYSTFEEAFTAGAAASKQKPV